MASHITRTLMLSKSHNLPILTKHSIHTRHNKNQHNYNLISLSSPQKINALTLPTPKPTLYTTQKRSFRRSPFGPASFYTHSKDDFQAQFDPDVYRGNMRRAQVNREYLQRLNRFRNDRQVWDNIMRQQKKLNDNLYALENRVAREHVFGKKNIIGAEIDIDLQNFEKRQRFLLDKIYREQVEDVIDEFEQDYGPMMAAHARKKEREVFWAKWRHRLRFIWYPISLTFNALLLTYKTIHQRHYKDTQIRPRIITETEFLQMKTTLKNVKRGQMKKLLQYPQSTQIKFLTLFDTGRLALRQRYTTLQTEWIRFKRYSNVNSIQDFFHWFSSRSSYDPAQYELRQQITRNIISGFKRKNPKPLTKIDENFNEANKSNPTIVLSPDDEEKMVLRWFHKFVNKVGATAESYDKQPFWVRKIREFIDMWYDVFKPSIVLRLIRFNRWILWRAVDRKFDKELRNQEKLLARKAKEMRNGRNPNSYHNIMLGIRQERSITKYFGKRFRSWVQHRKNATLYDVAAKNTRYFSGPSGPPFYRTYLETRHLLRSPFNRVRVRQLTVGQEEVKSFFKKWENMNNDLAQYPQLRKMMINSFHDNLMLRSTIYFRIARYLRRKKPWWNDFKQQYFTEFIRVWNNIFFNKPHYTLQELYTLAVNDSWITTQSAIKKYDRFDNRIYTRFDEKDTSILFSILSCILSFGLLSLAWKYSTIRREQYDKQRADQERLLYIADGSDMSHYAEGLLYADKRQDIIDELRYNGLMKLHDVICSRSGTLADYYYSILDEAYYSHRDELAPPNTIVFSNDSLANIANIMKGKTRDLDLADNVIANTVQNMFIQAAKVYALESDVAVHPEQYTLEQRQEFWDIGHFLMTHIDKIAQSATFPEYEGLPQLSYIIDDGVIKLKDSNTQERLMTQEQEERLHRLEETNTFLELSKGLTYMDHENESPFAKMSRLESNFQLLLQLLDSIMMIQQQLRESNQLLDRILEIPSSQEIHDMQVNGTFKDWLIDWHKKHQKLLPSLSIPKDFAELKAKQIYQDTGNRQAAVEWYVYYQNKVKPGFNQILHDNENNNHYTIEDFDLTTKQIEHLIALDEAVENNPDHPLHDTVQSLASIRGISHDKTSSSFSNSGHNEKNDANDGYTERVLYPSDLEKLPLTRPTEFNVFRPHVNHLVREINRLIQLRPRIFKDVKNQMLSKFPGIADFDKEMTRDFSESNQDDLVRMWRGMTLWTNWINNQFTMDLNSTQANLMIQGQLPFMLAAALRFKRESAGNTAKGIHSQKLHHHHPKPSDVAGLIKPEDIVAMNDKFASYRNPFLDTKIPYPLQIDDETCKIVRTPDNYDVVYSEELDDWDQDELKAQVKRYMQWFTGDIPSMIDTSKVTPLALEWAYDTTSVFDNEAYYDAWTDIYQLIARKKRQINPNYKPRNLTLPYGNIFAAETSLDYDSSDPVRGGAIAHYKRIPLALRHRYDMYQAKTYGTDHEFWYNRRLFYSRIDRYFKYFRFFLNRQWGRDILLNNNRWERFKREVLGIKVSPLFYQEYFLKHGFYHFLTSDPVYARYGNDFFFRYFIDAPKFDRRPRALLDRHRYDKDGEDIYYDPLYNTRILNNPYPLWLEHMCWSFKPWNDFVNAQFAVYRYLIISDGKMPDHFPQLYEVDLQYLEKFMVPDAGYGYDQIETWGKDLFDTTFKKHRDIDWNDLNYELKLKSNLDRPNYLDWHDDYDPDNILAIDRPELALH